MQIRFTDEQERIIQHAIHWFKYSSEQTFELLGEAGTGKSLVIYEIIRRLGLKQDQYLPMAYTGQAAIVMRLKGFPHARSIHSWLYEFQEIEKQYNNQIIMNHQFNVPETNMVFGLAKPNKIAPQVSLFVIDEGYLVSKPMRKDIESFGRKILVGGDTGQLPPVAGEPAYFGGYGVHRLTQVMRQAEGNPIVFLAHRARNGLPIHCGLYGNNVLVIEDKDLTNDMLSSLDTIICGTNATREFMNKYIRENIKGIYATMPIFGDRVICRNNNWFITRDNISLANGLVGTVVNMPDLSSFTGDALNIDFIPDLANTVFDQIPIDYKYLLAPYAERMEMKNRGYKMGEKFEYAYALTAYLAQGAEYQKGIYVEEFLRPQIQNQLNYTGITRFREALLYVKKSKNFQVLVTSQSKM